MTTLNPHPPLTTTPTPQVHRLRAGALTTRNVVFMAIATSAPITAMVGNVPVAVGSGNGYNAPAGFAVATIVLGLFALGYSAMAKHITATGAFYGFISRGLGRITGLASGLAVTAAYIFFAASLVGIFAHFAQSTVEDLTGIHLPWIIYAALMVCLNGLFSYFDITLASKVLGVLLVLEILALLAGAVAVAFHGGSMDNTDPSLHPEIINPLHAFSPADGVAGASAGLGLFFAFWSWVGFESTAMYGEESKNPKKIIPRATMIAVLGVGVFYVFVSWMAIAGTGLDTSVALAQDSATASDIFLGPIQHFYGSWLVTVFNILVLTGSFACGLAFHNCAARYIYALSRESLIPLFDALGKTHPKHRSPYTAALTQTALSALVSLYFFATRQNPYDNMYVELAIFGTALIMIVQTLCAFAVVSYFWILGRSPESKHWFTTGLAPLAGGICMAYVVYLLWIYRDTAAGAAASTTFFHLIPALVCLIFAAGAVCALLLRSLQPARYARIGATELK